MHGRDQGDRILSGPLGDVIDVQEKPDNREGDLQKMRQYVEPTDDRESLRDWRRIH